MRLIDADALRVWHPVGRPDIIKPKDVANAPTVRCEACVRRDWRGSGGCPLSRTSACDAPYMVGIAVACSYFERRQL